MKTKEDILNESFWTQELSGVMEGAVKVAMDKWADQQNQALKDKIKQRIKDCYPYPSGYANNLIDAIFRVKL
jgi:hypothetical protein